MKFAFYFFVTLLLLAVNAGALSWTDSSSLPSSGVQYIPNSGYTFQIAWAGDGYDVSNVFFESNFSTPNDMLTNITASNASGVYFVNFTGLPAGTYLYRWYAVDNSSNWNYTDLFIYIIIKNNSATILLFLNGTEGNRSYALNSMANFSAFLNLPNKAISLSSDYPGFSIQGGSSIIQNLTNLSSQGSFILTAYWDGDQNYSSSSKTYYFDNTPPQYSESSENPASGTSYSLGKYYNFNIKWFDVTLSQVLFESNHTGTFRNYTLSTNPSVQNNSNGFYITILDIPAEIFVYRWIASDGLTPMSNTSQNVYRIWKAVPLVLQVYSSANVSNGTQTTVRCISITNEVSLSLFNLYRDSTTIGNDTLYSRKDEQILGTGVYNYVCNNTETQNFTNQTLTKTLNVNTPQSNITSIILTGPSSIQSNTGETAESDFHLENNLGYSLSNITFELSGIDSSWYSISELPSSIPNNFSMIIRITFSVAGEDIEGDYNLNLRFVGRSPSNEVKVATKTVNLMVRIPQQQTFPPVYSNSSTNTTFYGDLGEFSLRWDDDSGLSGYIFSSNATGNWTNDSWVPFSGQEAISIAYTNISVSPGSTLSWIFYANDSNNLWTGSEEFDSQIKSKGSINDFLPIIALSVFVIVLAVLLLFITQRKSKSKTTKKENTVYIYKKEDIK
jgi:hypothetical protein